MDYNQTVHLPQTDFPMRAGLPKREPELLNGKWEVETYHKLMKKNEGKPKFVLHDGPPYANGHIHIGTALNKILKDIIVKYKNMTGFQAPYVPGWDTHGLPIESAILKDKKIKRDELTDAEFRDKCRDFALNFVDIQRSEFQRLGVIGDWENPYLTLKPEFEAKQIQIFGKMAEKGYIYKGMKPVYWCPADQTALAEAEIEYADDPCTTLFVKFPVRDDLGKLGQYADLSKTYFVIWTTTPWTLPSNVALCVNAAEDYVKVESKGETYYLAAALCDTVLGEGEYTVLETYKGADLEGKEYEPLFDFVSPKEKCWYVVCDDYVTLTDGTGVVHIAPAFGEDDAQVGRRYDLPFVQFVDGKGHMTEETPFAGLFVKDADPKVLVDLESRGLLYDAPKFEHDYPFCWRCDTPLLYYARESWFIKMTAVKDDLIRNNNTVNWVPESIGKGRFGDWLENVQDWGISRNRYWGTPLNIWECECGHRHSVGSIEELRSMSDNCPDKIELHRPYIDAVTIKCPHCGKQMKRVPEVIDCWFDSGAMPFAQHHYPFENKELFEQQFPADFISESVDQTRGWFYSLLAISTLIFNKAPYKNVVVTGLVQDENGQKMSKSKGNAVDPFEALAKYGADAIRWYFYTNGAPWLPKRFSDKGVQEGQRKLMGTLWNTYAFYVLYANIDAFDATKYALEYDKLSVMDKWILSKMNSMVKSVDENLAAYAIPEAARSLQEFVDDLSNWYVRRSRERFWGKDMPQDKINAYMTLYTALVTTSKAAAPMIPFMAESIYQNLVRSLDKGAPESVHLCGFPEADERRIDAQLKRDMDLVLKIVVLGRAARNGSNRKNRQPLAQMFVKAEEELGDFYKEIIEDELNIKAVTFTQDVSAFTSYSFKPQLKTLGPKYGKRLGEIRTALMELDGSAAKKELDANGVLRLELQGGAVELAPEDLLIEMTQSDRYFTVEDGGVTVAIDTELTEALIEEGFVRELVSKFQTMRKEAGFHVEDHIRAYASGNRKIEALLAANSAQVGGDILADAVCTGSLAGYTKEWDVNGEAVTLGVERI